MPPPPPPPPPPLGGPGQPGQGPPVYGQPYAQPGYGQPYAQPGFGPPYAQPGYAYGPGPFDSRAKTVLWLGILSLVVGFLCGVGLFAGPVAWIMGNGVRRDARAAGLPEPGDNKGGRVCGIIATVVLALGVIAVALLFAVAAASSSTR